MAKTFTLLRGSMTLSEAITDNRNILSQLSLVQKQAKFFATLSDAAKDIEAIVARRLYVSKADCALVNNRAEWMFGSFNVCIPVLIHRSRNDLPQKVLIRIPLTYKLGEEQNHGNTEEKLRSEVSTYIWIQENCPTVPIPRLLGFGLPNGLSFTPLDKAPILQLFTWYFNRITFWLRRSALPCRYIKHSRKEFLDNGYLLLEFVEHGAMLSSNWDVHLEDQERRANFFGDLSRIILTMAQIPLPRIGSWIIDDWGRISLTNRPLTNIMSLLENEGIPANISTTYDNVDSYYLDLLEHHDNRIKHQPNAIHDRNDGETQLACITLTKALMRHFTQRHLCHGPFVMQLTDLHPSNLFVDENWRITKVIDLEWACVRPLEMLLPLFWLTQRPLDGLFMPEHLSAYTTAFEEFMHAFESEGNSIAPERSNLKISPIMRATWKAGGYWYWQALDAPDCLSTLFQAHIQDYFLEPQRIVKEIFKTSYPFWSTNTDKFIQGKIRENEECIGHLREAVLQ